MAEPDSLAAFLRTMPLLRGIAPEDLSRLARRAPAPRAYDAGARDAAMPAVYDEGSPSTALCVVMDAAPTPDTSSGTAVRPAVQVSVEDDKLTTRVRLWRVYPRDYFGELEYLAGSEAGRFPVRLTKAVVLGGCRILEIPFKLLDAFIDDHPIVFRRLAREAIARFQQTLEDTLAGKVSDPDIALANWIVERGRDIGIRQGNLVRFRAAISQEDIGKDLGVTRETISLRLNEWRRRGLMGPARGQHLVVRDMERVERIAALAIERSRDEHRAAVAGVDAALARGDNFRARNFALDVLNYFPGSAELKHRAALAVARCGATREALGLLERFGFGREATPESIGLQVRCGIADPAALPKARMDEFDREEIDEQIAALGEKETVAALIEDILALSPRLWKDIAFQGGRIDRGAAEEACNGYRRAFTASGRPYTGVNAASLARVLGHTDKAEALARSALLKLRAPRDYWDFASKGELLLLQGDAAGAAACFEAAAACEDAFEGSIAATRLQLARLASAGIEDAQAMLDVLPNRAVATFCGPADSAGAATEAEGAAIRAAVGETLERHRIGHVHGALAAGWDIVAAETALEQGVNLHVVLPIPVDDYVAAFVAPSDTAARGGAPSWRERFESCLARAASMTILSQRTPPARELGAARRHGHRHAAGQALLKAGALMTSCCLLAAGEDAGADDPVNAWRDWRAAGHSVVALPPYPTSASGPAVDTPWRPVVFAWLFSTQAPDGQLSARGVTAKSVDAAETVFRASTDRSTAVLRRLLGGNRPQSALVAVAPDLVAALGIAERLTAAHWPRGVAAQVTLDFGPVLGAGGRFHEDRLKDLDTGSGPLEVPDGILVASASFAMEARLMLGTAISIVALGRVARLEPSTNAVQLLPSTEIYALQRV